MYYTVILRRFRNLIQVLILFLKNQVINQIHVNTHINIILLMIDVVTLSRWFSFICLPFVVILGVVGCGEGIVYLTSPERPTDIGLQLGKACYICILVAGKGRRGMFLFLPFLHFHSCCSFFPVPLFHLHYYISSISFLPFSVRRHKMTHEG